MILRKLELARFRQFRKSVLDKLKRNAMRHKRRFTEARKVCLVSFLLNLNYIFILI